MKNQRSRSRELAGPTRVGRFARGKAWTRVLSYLHRYWYLFLAISLLPLVFALYASWALHGPLRWAVVGASVISGPWLATLLLIVLSGIGTQVMGVQGEEWTAQELRRLRRSGWELVNGLQLWGNADIDHIVVGPAGLFVVETKWSSDSWPLSASGNSVMHSRLTEAIKQGNRSLENVRRRFRSVLNGVPTGLILVLWSSDLAYDEARVSEIEGATVVPGHLLRSWLKSLDGTGVSAETVNLVWAEMDQAASRKDLDQVRRGVRYRPTMRQTFYAWGLEPLLGALAALGVIIFLARAFTSWIDQTVGLIIFLVFGILAFQATRLRTVAIGWFIGMALSVVAVLSIFLKTHL